MPIIETLDCGQFVRRFREIRPDNFTREGLRKLYDYLEELSDDIGEPIEFCPVAICCEYVEYDSPAEAATDYCDCPHGETCRTWGELQEHHDLDIVATFGDRAIIRYS